MLKLKVFNYQTGEFHKTVLTPETTSEGECFIGRTPNCDLVLANSDVSRMHGKIKFEDGKHYFSDLGSANGSRLNNEETKPDRNYPIKKDDLIRIGDFILLVEAVGVLPPTENCLSNDRSWSKGDLTVRCVRIHQETPDVKTFTFVAADSPVLFSYKPGQFVTLELDIEGEKVLRSYSLSSTPSRPHTLEITVKRVPAPSDEPNLPKGLVSNWLHDNIKVGSTLKLSGPVGKFTCLPDPASKLLFISAGSGITPMMSMARWLADTATESDIVFFHSARTPKDIIFRQELESLSARVPNFRLAITTSRSELGGAWLGLTGRLTKGMLYGIAPDFSDRTVYVCGPDSFMQGVKTMFQSLDFPMQNYHEESFGPPKQDKNTLRIESLEEELSGASSNSSQNGASASSPSLGAVNFASSGKEISCDGKRSILELAERENIKIRHSCRLGVCGACKKRKLEGEVKYNLEPEALEQSDRDEGYVLTCVAHPVGRVVVEA